MKWKVWVETNCQQFVVMDLFGLVFHLPGYSIILDINMGQQYLSKLGRQVSCKVRFQQERSSIYIQMWSSSGTRDRYSILVGRGPLKMGR